MNVLNDILASKLRQTTLLDQTTRDFESELRQTLVLDQSGMRKSNRSEAAPLNLLKPYRRWFNRAFVVPIK